MPRYGYECECGLEFSLERPSSECSLPHQCPECGMDAHRTFHGVQFAIRGGYAKDPLKVTLPPGASDPEGRMLSEATKTAGMEKLWRGITTAAGAARKPEDGCRVIASMSAKTAAALNKKTGGALYSPDVAKVLKESGALFDHEKKNF